MVTSEPGDHGGTLPLKMGGERQFVDPQTSKEYWVRQLGHYDRKRHGYGVLLVVLSKLSAVLFMFSDWNSGIKTHR